MKAAVYYDINDIRIEEKEIPVLGFGEALIRMRACGLCGTDIHKAVHKTVKPPIVLGHEVSGDIVDVGPGVENFKPGDRIFVAHHVPCFTCHYCLHGHHSMCRQFKETNIEPGGFSEYIRIPALHVKHSMIKIPQDMTYEQGAMMEPVACCLRAVERAKIQPGDSVMVIGGGQVGVILAQLAKAYHAGKVIVSDISDFRLSMASKLGADVTINAANEDLKTKLFEVTEGKGVDVAFVAASVPAMLSLAVECVIKGGVVVSFAIFDKNKTVNINVGRICEDEVSIIGSYSSTPFEYNTVRELIYNKKIDVNNMITHRFTLDKLNDAIQMASDAKENYLKVIITP